MPTAEGRGRARAAWDAYVRGTTFVVEKTPLNTAVRSVSANAVADIVGFWVVWHLYGGFEGLRKLGMSRASIYRKTALFRKLFGAHPDEYEFPGITLDLEAHLQSASNTDE